MGAPGQFVGLGKGGLKHYTRVQIVGVHMSLLKQVELDEFEALLGVSAKFLSRLPPSSPAWTTRTLRMRALFLG